jgi:choice-of-anchor B domain-containing protein
MLKSLLAFLLAATALHAQGADSLNMTLVGHLNPVTGVGPHAALWGYTAPDGREYALFGSQIGTYVIDITAEPIRTVDFVPGPVDQWREIKTYGRYAYVVTENLEPGGVQVLDLSTLPDSVRLVGVDNSVVSNVHTIQIVGHYLYAMGTVNGGATIMDLEPDPAHPRLVGVVSTTYFHDAFIRNDTLLGAAIYGGGCEIWDIRDKANPRYLSTIFYPNNGTHNAELTPDGRYVLTSDEIGGTPKTMKVWDIGDLDAITKVAEFTPSLDDIVHNVHSIGRYAYVAWYTAGVRVVDMIDPTNPREVGFYDTYAGASGGYNGVWEVYAHFPSGKIIASDRQSGLWVLRFNGATAVNLSGIVRDSVTGRPIEGAVVTIAGGAPQTTGATGRYRGGSARGRTMQVRAGAYGYIPKSEQVVLDGDVTRDILLAPSSMATVRITVVDTSGATISPFAYSVEPYIPSTPSPGDTASVTLPADTLYSIYIGRWGYVPKLVTFTATPGLELRVVLRRRYQDDARLDLGWQYANSPDTIPFGRVWLSPASGEPAAPTLQATGTPGNAFATMLPSARTLLSAPTRVTSGRSILTSPMMDLRDHPAPLVILDLWMMRGNPSISGEAVRIELSNDAGATWIAIPFDLEEGRWWRVRIAPKEYLQLTESMLVRIVADGTTGIDPVVAMDNFFVTPNGAAAVREPDGSSTSGSLRITPNPVGAGDLIEITLPSGMPGDAPVELFDVGGWRIAMLEDAGTDRSERSRQLRIPDTVPSGVYLLHIPTESGSSLLRQILVK